MPELNEACLKLSMLLKNPYAVARYEQHRQNIQAAWYAMSKQVSKNTNGGIKND